MAKLPTNEFAMIALARLLRRGLLPTGVVVETHARFSKWKGAVVVHVHQRLDISAP